MDKRIQEYVSSFYSAAWGELAADPAREDAARLCALGNPAACEH